MALIVEYHVNADMYAVGTTAISAGMIVELNTAGLVVPVAGLNNDDNLGIAGDSALAQEGQTTAYSAQVTIGADGAGTRWTENRVSDFYDETTASQKITVYNGGGKFWISSDLLAAGETAAIGALYESSNTAGNWVVGAAAADTTVALGVGAAQAYPSGVPGTDIDGSITLGNYFPVVLRI
jgi:hypothetical protein